MYGPMIFTLVPHKDVNICHRLELGPFLANLRFPSVVGPFMRADENIGWYMEEVYTFKL